MTALSPEQRVKALREKVQASATGVSALHRGQNERREHYVSLYCPTLIERSGEYQTWYGRSPEQALDRAEHDINRRCDKAMAEKGGNAC